METKKSSSKRGEVQRKMEVAGFKDSTSHELQFLDQFIEKHLDNVEYFVDGQRTNLTELF
jgi:hypothetical protein